MRRTANGGVSVLAIALAIECVEIDRMVRGTGECTA